MLDEILAKVNEKGWDLYEGAPDVKCPDIFGRGPAMSLQDGKQYLVLPHVDQSADSGEMKSAVLQKIKTDGYAVMELKGRPTAFMIVEFSGDYAIVRHLCDDRVPLQELVVALDTLQDRCSI